MTFKPEAGTMKIKGVFFAAILMAILCVSSAVLAGSYSGGSGTAEDPYQIADVNDLLELGATTADYNKSFIMMVDIDLTNSLATEALVASDTSISYGFQGVAFTGKFDGSGHTISHYTIHGGNNDYLGLFGLIAAGGEVKNIGLQDCTISESNGAEFVGCLVGFNQGSISNCHSTTSVSGSSKVGGLVGYNNNGHISHCYSTATVSGSYSIGGLAGDTYYGSISYCYSTATVNGSQNVGGLVGYNSGTTSITHCNSAGSVSGMFNLGGLVGSNYMNGSIGHCYSTATVSGGSSSNCIGGLVGTTQYSGVITECYSTGPVIGFYYVGGLVGQSRYSNVTNCYSTGLVVGSVGSRYVAGLMGYLEGGSINKCYSMGAVAGSYNSQNIGGLLGYNTAQGSINDCFWDIETSGQTTSVGGTGKMSAEMKTLSTFTSAIWNFVDIWGIIEIQTYPYLQLQPSADLNHDGTVDLADFTIFAAQWLDGI